MGRSHLTDRKKVPKVRVSRDEPKRLWPEIRINRLVELSVASEVYQWNEFQNDLGRINYGIGNAKSLGSIAVNYFNAKQMGWMIEKKYPDMYASREKTIDFHRSLRRRFNDFVNHNGNSVLESPFGPIVLDASDIETLPHQVDLSDRIWKPANFVTSELTIIDGVKLGFSFAEDEHMNYEYEQAYRFMQAEGFDVSSMHPNNVNLHATVLTTFNSAQQRMPRLPESWPVSLRLDQPAARCLR